MNNTNQKETILKKIDTKLIQELREKTGLGIMDCRKALVESSGSIEKAIEILKNKGAKIAEKRGMNLTNQGIIHSYIHSGSRIGVLLELNCETDFVANTDVIKQLAHDIAMHIAAMNPSCICEKQMKEKKSENKDCLLMQEFIKDSKKTINDVVNETIAKVGENIKINRFTRYEIGKI